MKVFWFFFSKKNRLTFHQCVALTRATAGSPEPEPVTGDGIGSARLPSPQNRASVGGEGNGMFTFQG
jgi:hypothetical protein